MNRSARGQARALHAPGTRRGRGPRLAALLLLVVLVGGCLTDAADTCFEWDNVNDPAMGDNSCDDTETGSSTVAIVSVDVLNEVAVLSNPSLFDEDMTAWTLANQTTGLAADIFTFPAFTLATGQTVRLHAALGTDDADDLYWDGADHWGDNDTLILYDDAGSPIDDCADGDACWNSGT